MTVLGCTGHQDIPPQAAGHVASGIRSEIERHASARLIGVCSLAAGADQIFARGIVAAGGRLHAVIPCRGYEQTFHPTDLDAYHSCRASADRIELLPYDEPSESAYLSAGRRVVDLADVLIAVWDGREAKGRGGTGDVVGYARRRHRPVVVIWPSGVAR